MISYDFDLFTIGAGSGGVRASRIAGSLGKRVAVAEESHLGGTCVNLGCVPKKLMVYAAQFGEAFTDSAGFGWSVEDSSFDWAKLIAAKDKEILRLNSIYGSLLDNSDVDLIEGRARLVDAHSVEVNNRIYTSETILIATGGQPSIPSIPGIENVITSDQVFHLKKQPKRIIIVGGGYIAVEFAGIFNALGTDVVQLYRGPLFLRGFDSDIRTSLVDEMTKRSIDLRFNSNPESIEIYEDGLKAVFSDGDALVADQILYATGRLPNTSGIGLEDIGITMNKAGAIVTDEYSRSSVPSIYAVGDCTDRMNLTPVAIAEAMALIKTLYLDTPTIMSYDNVPTAVFSQPNIGTVGLTEAAARDRFPQIDIFKSSARPMKHNLSGRNEKTMLKLVVDRGSDRVLGVHMVGPDAGEIIQGMAVALQCGVTKAKFDATVGIHPTLAEEFVTMREPVKDDH